MFALVPALGFVSAADTLSSSNRTNAPDADSILWYLGVILFGASVGVAELFSRYKDEPWQTIRRWEGILYVLFNSLLSLAAFAFLSSNDGQELLPTLSPLSRALLGGFGAMALLRSKVLTFRTSSDEDIPVGLEAVANSFLQTLDRGVDRSQSSSRWNLAFRYLHDIRDPLLFDRLVDMFRVNLRSYQNVPTAEIEIFESTVAGLYSQTSATVSPALRSIAVGIAFQAIAGGDNFAAIAAQFREAEGLPSA